MAFLKNVANIMTDTKDYIVEKNKRASAINKLRLTIKSEKSKADKAYIALGRYYFHNMRDIANTDTEANCLEIEQAEQVIEQAAIHLEKIYKEDIIKKNSVNAQTKTEEVTQINNEDALNDDSEIIDGVVDESVAPQ